MHVTNEGENKCGNVGALGGLQEEKVGMVEETRGRWQTWQGDVVGHEGPMSMGIHAYDGYTWGWVDPRH